MKPPRFLLPKLFCCFTNYSLNDNQAHTPAGASKADNQVWPSHCLEVSQPIWSGLERGLGPRTNRRSTKRRPPPPITRNKRNLTIRESMHLRMLNRHQTLHTDTDDIDHGHVAFAWIPWNRSILPTRPSRASQYTCLTTPSWEDCCLLASARGRKNMSTRDASILGDSQIRQSKETTGNARRANSPTGWSAFIGPRC